MKLKIRKENKINSYISDQKNRQGDSIYEIIGLLINLIF